MRALCGAIVTAGALIGLGLTAIGIGLRYQSVPYQDGATIQYVEFRHIDTSLMIAMIGSFMAILIGLGITFLGLAYHHHRRHLESLRYTPHQSSERALS